jgi:hypothetical protein
MRLSNVAIMSKAWALAHGVRTPVKQKGGEETFASRHANGTGPFMLEEFEPDGRWVMVRNPNWWGTTEYPHNIDRIDQTWNNKSTGSTKPGITMRSGTCVLCSMARLICCRRRCTRASTRSVKTPT